RGHGHRRIGAGTEPAQPGPLHRGSRPTGGALRQTDGGRPGPGGPQCRCSGPGVDGCRGLSPQHLVDRNPGATRWFRGPRGQCQQDPLVRDRPGHPQDGVVPVGPRGRVPGRWHRCGMAGRLPLCPGRPHLCRHQRDPTKCGGRAHARTTARLSGSRTAMHFAFTDQQTEFKDAVRQVLARECTTDDLRAAFDAPAARTPRWTMLAELGVVGLSVPEDQGGLGLGLVDLVLLLEEAGRSAMPEPLLESTALTAPLLVELVDGNQAGAAKVASWLQGIAGGEIAAAVAETWSGVVPVAGADSADLLVLFAPGDGDGPEIHVVESDMVTVAPVASLDPTRRLGIPQWTPSPETRVASGRVA